MKISHVLSVALISFSTVCTAETMVVGQQAPSSGEAQSKAEALLEKRLKNACAAQGGLKESRLDSCKIEQGLGQNKRAECKATYFCNNPR